MNEKTSATTPANLKLFGLLRPLKVGILVAIFTAGICISIPNQYRSEARILPSDNKGSGGGLSSIASAAAAMGVPLSGGDGAEANFVDILQSRWLKEQLINQKFKFSSRTWMFGASTAQEKTLKEFFRCPNDDFGVGRLDSVMHVNRDLKSHVILVSAETTSPELSQAIVQEGLRLLETFLQEKTHTHGGAKADFAAARLVDARREMAKSEDAFRVFLEVNRNYQQSMDPSIRLAAARLEAELKLRQQLVMSLAMNLESALMEEKNDIPVLNVMDPGNLPLEKSGPARSSAVLMAFLLSTVGLWFYFNRKWFREKFIDNEA